jgi:hypothetical protein
MEEFRCWSLVTESNKNTKKKNCEIWSFLIDRKQASISGLGSVYDGKSNEGTSATHTWKARKRGLAFLQS